MTVPSADIPAPPARRFSGRVQAGAALVSAWAVFFAHALLTSDLPFERDVGGADLPWRQFLQDGLSKGQLPQWYPYETLGVPFVGSFVAGTFHPQTLLLLWLTAGTAMKVSLLASYLVALCGGYRAARCLRASRSASVTAAFALAFGGYSVGLSNNLACLVPFATLPWVFFFAWRLLEKQRLRDAALLSLFWALVLLGGDVQAFAECGVLVLAALLIQGIDRRRGALVLLSAALAVALTCVELIPGTYVARESFRAVWKNTEFVATRWALHPWRLPEFAVAHFVPYQWRNWLGEKVLTGRPDVWSSTIFAGGLTLWLGCAGLARRTRATWVLGGLTLAAVWLALGHYGGLLEVFWKVLPLASRFRYPEKYLALAWVTGSLLVALGFDALKGRAVLAVGGGFLALAIICTQVPAVAWMLSLRGIVLSPQEPILASMGATWVTGLWMVGVWLLIGGAVVRFQPRRRAVLIPLLVFGELYVANHGSYRDASAESVLALVPWAEVIDSAAPPRGPPPRTVGYTGSPAYRAITTDDERALMAHAVFRGDDSGRAGLAFFGGEQLPNQSERTKNLVGGKVGLDVSWRGAFNVCFRVEDENHPLATGESVAATVDWVHLDLVRQPCRPRAYVAGAIPAESEVAARETLRGGGVPADTVVWEGGPALPPTTGTVTWDHYASDSLALNVVTNAPAALVVSDALASGWSATVDGVAATIWPTNTAVRGVEVPAGTHRVEMRYRAPGLQIGAGITLLALLIIVALLVLGGTPPPRRP